MKKTINRGYKIRIYPNFEQATQIKKTIGCCRLIYNISLEERINIYEKYKDEPDKYSSYKFKSQKNWKEEYPFISEADSQALNTSQRHLATAFKSFYKKINSKPRFKSSKHSKKSYTTHTTENNVRIEGDYIKLPKLQYVKLKKKRKALPEGSIIKAATVSISPSGNYYVSLRLEYEAEPKVRDSNFKRVLGLDFSTTYFYIDNEGKRANFPKHIERTLEKIKKCNRKMSKQVKGSNGRERTRIKLAKLYEKKSNQLKDYHHKLSNFLISNYDIIGIETLSLKEMDERKYFRQRIQLMGWKNFINILIYKSEDNGVILHKADKFYASSKICSVCGHKKETFPLSQKVYSCECGNAINRDINAAINLAKQGMIAYLTA